jgi:hypothetical protein
VALLGVGLADQRLAEYVHTHYPLAPVVVSFDADPRGKASTMALVTELRRAGQRRVEELRLPAGVTDLNQWASLKPADFRRLAESPIRPMPKSPCPSTPTQYQPDRPRP